MDQAQIALHEAHPKESVSFGDYLKTYNSVERVRTEWVAGEVESYTVTNNLIHQRLLRFLATLFGSFLEVKSLGEVILAGFPMYLGDDKPAREPDLMIVLNAHRERIKPTYLDGIADLVVEIVSPESDERDHGKKYIEYEAIGISEYWLIDPIRQESDVYVLG
jgi:Uma2 family endonuclease